MDEMTDTQWERLAYGTVLSAVNQVIDNGELNSIDVSEYMPSGWHGLIPWAMDDDEFYKELKVRVEKILSNIEEEAAKRDS